MPLKYLSGIFLFYAISLTGGKKQSVKSKMTLLVKERDDQPT